MPSTDPREYTPTIEDMRAAYADLEYGSPFKWADRAAEFDRGLAAYGKAQRAEALREAADQIDLSAHYDPSPTGRVGSECRNAESAAEVWLRTEADRIESGDHDG